MIRRVDLAEITLRVSAASATQHDAKLLLDELLELRADFARLDAQNDRTTTALTRCQEDCAEAKSACRLALAANDTLRTELDRLRAG